MAVTTKVLLDTVDQIYQAACDPDYWPEVLASCQSLFPGTAFSLFISEHGAGHDPLSATAGWDPEAIRQYFEHYYKLNPFLDLLQCCAPGQVVRESHLFRHEWLERQPFYQEWLKPAGNYTHGANLTLARGPGTMSRISIDIPQGLSDLEAAAAEFLQRLSPHLARAFVLSSRLQATRVTETGLQGLLDRVSGAAFLVHISRKVVAANRRAVALLEQHRLVHISLTTKLSFVAHGADEAFRYALQGIVEPPASFIATDESSGRYPVLVLPFRIARPLATLSAAPELALVLIIDRRCAPSPPRKVLKSLYGLSHAEANVALSIAGGDGLQAVADRLGICRATARNQLAAAMAKLGVHRQAELVAVVAALAPGFDLDQDD